MANSNSARGLSDNVTSLRRFRQFGVLRSLTDTVYRMNAEHLSHDVDTVFESLDHESG